MRGTSVHVYRLRYGDARTIARVLGDLFGIAPAGGLNSAVNQIAPGAGVSTTSSGAFGNSQANNGLQSGGQPGAGNSSGLGGATSGSGLGGGGGGGGGGIQLGNIGSGSGNPNGVPGTASATGTSSDSIDPGAFGSPNAQGSNSISLPGIRIAADITNNSLVIYASQENYRLIEQTLAQLDRPQLQVAIHATIAEVTLNNDLQFGVEYYLQGNSSSFGFNTQSSGSSSSSGVNVGQALGAILPGSNLLLGPRANPRVVINALRNITDVKVLSSPSVVVLDNQPATLLVGDQVPVETQSANVLAATTSTSSTVVNSINYINTGVILRVLPRINVNGNVILDVRAGGQRREQTQRPQSLTPTVSQRQIKSSISVASGQTVLLGGLITETQQRTRSGIPVLEELPGIGNLFSTNDRSIDAHRNYHLHRAADHPQQRRCRKSGGRVARKIARLGRRRVPARPVAVRRSAFSPNEPFAAGEHRHFLNEVTDRIKRTLERANSPPLVKCGVGDGDAVRNRCQYFHSSGMAWCAGRRIGDRDDGDRSNRRTTFYNPRPVSRGRIGIGTSRCSDCATRTVYRQPCECNVTRLGARAVFFWLSNGLSLHPRARRYRPRRRQTRRRRWGVAWLDGDDGDCRCRGSIGSGCRADRCFAWTKRHAHDADTVRTVLCAGHMDRMAVRDSYCAWVIARRKLVRIRQRQYVEV